MMMDLQKFLMVSALEETTFRAWIAFGWLTPERNGPDWIFSAGDVARAQLIQGLVEDLGLNDYGVNAILELLDRIETTRRGLRTLLSVARTLPEALRGRVAAEILDGACAGDEMEELPVIRLSAELRRHIRL